MLDERRQKRLEEIAKSHLAIEGHTEIGHDRSPVMLQRTATDKFLASVILELQNELRATNKLLSGLIEDN